MQDKDLPSDEKVQRPRLAVTFARIATAIFLSKLVGFVRDIVVARAYGTGIIADAYNYASLFTLNFFILYGGLNGPFDTCTVSALVNKRPFARQIILKRILWMTTVWLIPLGALVYLLTPLLVPVAAMFYQPGAADLALDTKLRSDFQSELASQLHLMLPLLSVSGILGILCGAARANNKLVVASISPAVASLTIISFVFVAQHFYGIHVGWPLATATLIGCLLQLIVQIPGQFLARSTPKEEKQETEDEAVSQYKRMIIPAVLATSVGLLATFVDGLVALRLQTGAWTALTFSNRLVQLPLGILSTAIMVPVFQRLAEYASLNEFEELKTETQRSLRFLWFATLPILAIFGALCEPIVRLLFFGGKFNESSVSLLSLALIFQIPAMFAYVGRELLSRVFIAYGNTKVIFRISLLTLFLKAICDVEFALVLRMDVAGISLATTIVTTVNFLVLAVLLARNNQLPWTNLISPLLRMTIATVICWLCTSVIFQSFHLRMETFAKELFQTVTNAVHLFPSDPRGIQKFAGLFAVSISTVIGFLGYLILTSLLRIEEVRLLKSTVVHLCQRFRTGTESQPS